MLRVVQILTLLFLFANTSFAQDSLYQVALRSLVTAEYDLAYNQFETCANSFRMAKNGERYALCHLKMSECLLRSTQYESAIEHLENIESFITADLKSNPFLLSENKRIKGEILLNQGKLDESLELLLSAEKTYPENAILEKSEVYNLLGIVYWNNQNKTLALQYHLSALKNRTDQLDSENIKIADSYNNIGLIYLEDNPVQAKIYLNQALRIYEAQLGTLNPKVAFVLLNLSRASALQMRFKEAETYIHQVEQIWRNIYGEIDHPNITFTQVVKGQIKADQELFTEALIIQQEALQQYIRLYGPKHPDVANQHQIIGKIYRSMENFTEAIHSFQEAIFANLESQSFKSVYDQPEIKNYFHPDYLLSALMDKASTLEALHISKTLKQSDLIAAIATYKRADELISEIRKYRVSEADKLLLGNTSRQLYEAGCRLSLILGEQPFLSKKYFPILFEFMERSKAAVLQQAIQDTKAKSFAGIPESLLILEDSLKSQLAFHQQKIAAGEAIEFHKTKVFDYQTAYRNFSEELEANFPAYYALKYEKNTLTAQDIQKKLTDNECMIQYLLGKNQLFILYLTQDKIHAKSIPVTSTLKKNMIAFKNGLKYQMKNKTDVISRYLYDELIPTIGKNINKIYLLPDGLLNTFPFEALVNEKTQAYLIEEYNVSYAFAASMIKQNASTASAELAYAGLFAPISFQYTSEHLPKLNATNEEVIQLRALMKSADIAVDDMRKDKANESILKSNVASKYNILHLATHGKVNQSSPELSRLYLSPDTSNDGILFSGELYNLQLNAELVTLSACETGLGKIEAGEGIVGLSRALLYAGSNNLIVSLWTVSDQATAELMMEFYEQYLLVTAHQLGQSLRKAKLAMIKSDLYHDPYYWAPFILIGQ